MIQNLRVILFLIPSTPPLKIEKNEKEKLPPIFLCKQFVVIYVTAAALKPKLIDRTQYDINPTWQTYNCCIQLVLYCQFHMDAI